MKVLFVGNDRSILTGENGDARERMKAYAKYFDKLFIIIFSLKKDHLQSIIEENLEVYPTNSSTRWLFLFGALKIIRNLKVDLVSTQDPFITGLIGVFAKYLWSIKLNIQLHNDFFDSPFYWSESFQNIVFYWLGKFNLLFADSVRVVNKRMVKDRRYFEAPVATDLNFFWSKPHSKTFNQVVTVARLAKQKNLPLLFSLAKEFPDKRFVVVGEGEERKNLEKLLPNNVFLVGQQNKEAVKKILSKSDIFVLTSNYEGWGLAVVEALAAGLPVVMTDTGCAGEVIINNKTGKVVPVEDTRGMISVVNQLLSLDTINFVLAGQDLIKKKYNQKTLSSLFINGLRKT